MRVFVDIDGTLTNEQTGNSYFKNIGLREDVIAKVKEYHDAGHEIILWSGSTAYAKRVAAELYKNYSIDVVAAIGKPQVIVDNQRDGFARKLNKRCILPEVFASQPIPKE